MYDPEGKCRFFVDAMLGNVARRLRLLGYDSRYDSDIRDEELIRIAKVELRVIITGDRQLAGHCKRLGQRAMLVCSAGNMAQVREVLSRLHLDCPRINGDVARCTRCNSATEPAAKQDVSGMVPPGVLDRNERFWRCVGCDQVYWEGTHIKNIQEAMDRYG